MLQGKRQQDKASAWVNTIGQYNRYDNPQGQTFGIRLITIIVCMEVEFNLKN
jgi:hypothetical protein